VVIKPPVVVVSGPINTVRRVPATDQRELRPAYGRMLDVDGASGA